MYNHFLYLLYWLVNFGVLLFLGLVYPDYVHLGVNKFVPIEAAIYGGFWLTFFIWCMWDLIIMRGIKLEPDGVAWVYFLLVNVLGVLAISYASRFTGVSVAGWWLWIVAFFANGLQRLFWQIVISRRI